MKACGGDPEFGHRKDVPQVDRRGHEDRSSLPPQRTETGQVVPTSRQTESKGPPPHVVSRALQVGASQALLDALVMPFGQVDPRCQDEGTCLVERTEPTLDHGIEGGPSQAHVTHRDGKERGQSRRMVGQQPWILGRRQFS